MPSQLHHIPGKQNPANQLTRGITVPQMNIIWFSGPECIHKSSWPFTKGTFAIPVGDLEMKKSIINHYITTDNQPFEELLQYHSCWTQLFNGFA